MKRAWLIITTYKRSLSFPHSNYASFEYFFFFFLVGRRLALNFFFFWWGEGRGWQEMGREVDTLQVNPSFWKSRYFYIVCKPFTRVNITEMALSFQFIYLSPLYIDRQIKMNLSRGSMHATSIYSSNSLFLFSLKRNLSFLFKIPSSLSLQASLQEALLPCFVPETLLKAKRWR